MNILVCHELDNMYIRHGSRHERDDNRNIFLKNLRRYAEWWLFYFQNGKTLKMQNVEICQHLSHDVVENLSICVNSNSSPLQQA